MSKDTALFRNSRDRVLDWMPNLSTFPIRDHDLLPFSPKVGYNNQGSLTLKNSQFGVEYTLVDVSTNPDGVKTGNAKRGTGGDLQFLTGPLTNRFYTFRIKARKFTLSGTTKVYGPGSLMLNTVTLQVGLDLSLVLDLTVKLVDFDTQTGVIIHKAQKDVAYELYTDDTDILLGKNDSGDGGILTIPTSKLKEDTVIKVKAINQNSGQGEAEYLENKIEVLVRPNPDLQLTVLQPIIDFNTPLQLKIANSQKSTNYTLRTQAMDNDFWDPATQMNEITSLEWEGTDGDLILSSFPIKEDSVFNIIARKISTIHVVDDGFGNLSNHPVELQLTQIVQVQARPDTSLPVAANPAEVEANETTVIQVSNPQKGIHYQLRNDVNNSKIGNPVFFNWNRGIGQTALNMDYVIGGFVGDTVNLPSNKITAEKTFNVLATKAKTGISAKMDTVVTVTVKP
ncbi:MAG: hypothetical protein H6581_04750 [Bacteroidia bacterium]|nr:hypothetical protein [Bacteroidia bacterium]